MRKLKLMLNFALLNSVVGTQCTQTHSKKGNIKLQQMLQLFYCEIPLIRFIRIDCHIVELYIYRFGTYQFRTECLQGYQNLIFWFVNIP